MIFTLGTAGEFWGNGTVGLLLNRGSSFIDYESPGAWFGRNEGVGIADGKAYIVGTHKETPSTLVLVELSFVPAP